MPVEFAEEEPVAEGEEQAEKEADDALPDGDADDRIPCNWRYVANCFLLPLTNGGVNGFPWSGVALFFKLQGWALWKLGACSFAGFSLRVCMALLYLRLGTWLSLVTTTIHLACCIPAVANPNDEWAVMLEMIVLLGMDAMIPNDAIVFYNYCDSETQAQRASSQVLQSLVACYAVASTLGGIVYDLAGWRGCATYHLAFQLLQAFLIYTEPAVWASFAEWRRGEAVSDEDEVAERQASDVFPSLDEKVAKEDEPITPVATGPLAPDTNPPALLCGDSVSYPLPKPPWVLPPAKSIESLHKVNVGQNELTQGTSASRVNGSTTHGRGSFFGSMFGGPPMPSRPSQIRASAHGSVARRSLMSKFSGSVSRSTVAVQMCRRTMVCRNRIPTVMPGEATKLMFFDEEEQEPAAEEKKKKGSIPRDTLVPAVLTCLLAFTHNLSYQSEWSLYAVFFMDYHGWESATWAGLAQTSGDVIGAIIMQFQARCEAGSDEEGFAGHGCQRAWYTLTAKPYTASWILLFWGILNFGMTAPSLPAAVAAQVIMGTVFVLSMQATTKMNIFFSLGDGHVFLALQVMRQNFESVGSALAGLVSLLLYEQVHPLSPFWLTGGVSFIVLALYTLGFCQRVGFGKSLEEAEANRSQAKGITREKAWQKSPATIAA